MTYRFTVKGALHAFATSSLLGLATSLMAGEPVLAQEQHALSMPAQADAQIASLLDKLEQVLGETQDISGDELEMLIAARLLMSNASVRSQRLLRDFPARLNEHADREPNLLKSVKLKVFADTAKTFLMDESFPEPAQIPTIAGPDPPKGPTPEPLPLAARERAGLDQIKPPATILARPTTPSASPPRAQSSMDHALLDRGDAMLALGDVSAARLLYARAAATVGIAALKLADTYDSVFLATHNLRGIKPDPSQAERWYRKAAEMGEMQAADRLNALQKHSSANLLETRQTRERARD